MFATCYFRLVFGTLATDVLRHRLVQRSELPLRLLLGPNPQGRHPAQTHRPTPTPTRARMCARAQIRTRAHAHAHAHAHARPHTHTRTYIPPTHTHTDCAAGFFRLSPRPSMFAQSFQQSRPGSESYPLPFGLGIPGRSRRRAAPPPLMALKKMGYTTLTWNPPAGSF